MVANPSTGGWTSRRRLLEALRCGVPDRVPINTYELAGHNSLDWYNNQPSYRRLMDYIRAHSDCITNWNPQPPKANGTPGVAYIAAERFACSSFPVPIERQCETTPDGRRRTTTTVHTPRGDLRAVSEIDPNVYTTWQIEHFCKNTQDVDKALSVPYLPAGYDASDLSRVRAELGERGIVMASLGDPAYTAAEFMSFQDYTVWAFEETEHFARAVDAMAERVMENLRRQLDTCVVDLYRICGPEYMTPPYLPPSFFERFMVPHVKAMTELIHARGGKVRLHCHGKIGRVLDMFFETGCDGTDPCEPPPDGDIALDEVKRRCAARGVSVWGNMELKVLEHGTAAQVRANVKEIMNQAKHGGGFVLLPTAGPINLPLSPQTEANYMAFIDAGLEFGKY